MAFAKGHFVHYNHHHRQPYSGNQHNNNNLVGARESTRKLTYKFKLKQITLMQDDFSLSCAENVNAKVYCYAQLMLPGFNKEVVGLGRDWVRNSKFSIKGHFCSPCSPNER